MLIVVLIPATALAAVWIVFLLKANREDWIAAAYNKVLHNQMETERLRRKDAANSGRLEQYRGISARVMKLFLKCDSSKEIEKLGRQSEALQAGNLKSLSPLILPGYAIQRQFPNVVSKLALLVTSGMIMERAWQETAQSQDSELYQEMRRTAEEMKNLVKPADAYANFIDRCNRKETTKLASAIIQNQSKGNAEIGALLKNMAHEAWQERRHMAKRDSEAANSKLMIPTMMLFIAILVIIMVPVVLNFSGLI